MKISVNIFLAVAGMLALSSCAKDDNDVQNAPRQMTFTASYVDGAQTRATMDNLGGIGPHKVKFDSGDKISILSASNANVQFTTTGAEYGESATFSGMATDGDPTYYAVYPYTDGLTLNSSTGVISGVKIPASQSNTAWASTSDGWDPTAPIAYAIAEGSALQFHNLCAILKIRADGNWQNTITISVREGESLAGSFDLDASSGTLTNPTAGSNTVTTSVVKSATFLTGNSGEYVVNSGTYVYIVIAPGTYHDFKIQWNGGDASNTKTKESVTFEAGKVYHLGTFATNKWKQVTNLYWYGGAGPITTATIPGFDSYWHEISGTPSYIETGDLYNPVHINWTLAVPIELGLNHISNGEDITDSYDVTTVTCADGVEYYVFTQVSRTKRTNVTITN